MKPLYSYLELYACIIKAPRSQGLLCHSSSILKLKPRRAFSSYWEKHMASWLHCVKLGRGEDVLPPPAGVMPSSRFRGFWIFTAGLQQLKKSSVYKTLSLVLLFTVRFKGNLCYKHLLLQIGYTVHRVLTYLFAMGNEEWHYTYYNWAVLPLQGLCINGVLKWHSTCYLPSEKQVRLTYY